MRGDAGLGQTSIPCLARTARSKKVCLKKYMPLLGNETISNVSICTKHSVALPLNKPLFAMKVRFYTKPRLISQAVAFVVIAM